MHPAFMLQDGAEPEAATGQWWRLYTDVTLAEALHILETDNVLHPL
jgi:hypothetical protein